MSNWHLFWLIQLVQTEPGNFSRIVEGVKLQHRLDPAWEDLVQLILDLRKLVLDPTEISLIETMIIANEGIKTFWEMTTNFAFLQLPKT